MALDPNIILSGRGVDVAGAMASGNALASQTNALRQQNALADLYRTQGAGLIAGDPGAVNALAAIDPGAALGMKDATRGMAWAEEDRAAAKAEGKRAAEEAMRANAASLTAEQIAAEKKEITDGLSGAAFFYQKGDEAGYNNFLTQQGMDPAQFDFADFPAHAAMFEGALEAMESFAPPAPAEPADEYGRYSAEEIAAGRQPLSRIDYSAAIKGNGVTQTITNPDGTTTTIQVGGAGKTATGAKPTEGSLASEGYLQRMKGAEAIFAELEAAGTTALGYTDRPLVDTDLETVKLTGPEQQLLQAQRDWVRAKLRKESGAVIGPEEMAAEIKQYFPQPGEGEKVIAQKKESRKRAEEQLRITAMLPEDGSGSPVDAGQDEIDLLMRGP